VSADEAGALPFPAPDPRTEGLPAGVRFGATAAAVGISIIAGWLLWNRAAITAEALEGASLYNSGNPGDAYPRLLAAVRGTSFYARPCLDLGDMAVWAIDDGAFQHFYKIEDPRTLARLAFLSYAETLKRQPGSSKAWAGIAELFKKARILRVKEGTFDLDALDETAPSAYDEEDRLVIGAYQLAVRFEPNNYFYHAYLGDFYDERGFRAEALASYAKAIEVMPDLSWHYYLPKTDVPEDLYAAASGALNGALRTNTGFTKDRIWQNMGDLAERGHDPASALQYYRRAADTAHDPSPYLYLLGSLYFTEKRYDEAEPILTESLSRGTLQPRVKGLSLTLLGRCAMLRKDNRKAVDYLKQARWISPHVSYIAVDLGRAYEQLGQFDKAEPEYLTAIRLDPSRASVYTALIDMYRRTRQINKAIPLAERLVRMFPDDPIFKTQLRALNRELGREEAG